jgi:hypothetical protein
MEAAVGRAVGTGYGSATPTGDFTVGAWLDARDGLEARQLSRAVVMMAKSVSRTRLSDRDDTEVSEAGAVAAAIARVSSGGQAFLRGGWGHVNRLAAVPPPRQVIAIFASLIVCGYSPPVEPWQTRCASH